MREIGSEFWDIPISGEINEIFPESTQWFLSGRSALQAIIKELKGINSIAMPSWCCESVIKPFIDAGIEVYFYYFCMNENNDYEIKSDADALFMMDYFGYTSGITSNHGLVIRDVTHSIFSATYTDADYYFGSLRKWCGVWTGGFGWKRSGEVLTVNGNDDRGYSILRRKAMELKEYYIRNKSEDSEGQKKDKDYLTVYAQAERLLDDCGAEAAEYRDIECARKLDVDFIKKRRRSNAKILMQEFSDQLLFPELRETDCPMFVPIIVRDGRRDALRQFLIANKIYCPIHWPISNYHVIDGKIKEIYDSELSLVCDQRYTEDDMYRIVETIKCFWKEK